MAAAAIDDLYTKDQNGYGPYLLNPEDKISSWGTPYQYDPSGQNNQQKQPDVYVQIPSGGRVVNWSHKPLMN